MARKRRTEPLLNRLQRVTGTELGSEPTVRQVADALGVSRSSARRYLSGGRMSARVEARLEAVERAEARKPRWIAPTDQGAVARTLLGSRQVPSTRDVTGQLMAVYGEAGKVNVRAAAQGQGVSQSTVRRWLKGESRPSEQHQRALRSEVRQRAATANKRTSRLQNQGARVMVRATVIVSNEPRHRTIGQAGQIRLSGTDMQAITESWKKGGDSAALNALKHAIRHSKWGQEIGLDDTSLRFGLRGVDTIEFS